MAEARVSAQASFDTRYHVGYEALSNRRLYGSFGTWEKLPPNPRLLAYLDDLALRLASRPIAHRDPNPHAGRTMLAILGLSVAIATAMGLLLNMVAPLYGTGGWF